MKFYDIPADILTVRVKRTDISSDSLREQSVFSVSPCPSRPGEFEIRLKDSVIFVKPTVDADTWYGITDFSAALGFDLLKSYD